MGAGGGGGGAIGTGAIGGRGGDGGAVGPIDLEGSTGDAPGSGGGGGGSIAPDAIRYAGPKDGTLGWGYSEGHDGEDGGASYFGSANAPLLYAPGGHGGLAGSDQRATSDVLSVSVLLSADYADLRDGLFTVVRGGHSEFRLLNVPTDYTFALIVVFEAGGAQTGDYTAIVEILDPVHDVAGSVRFPIVVVEAGDVVRIPRLVRLNTRLRVFGAYQVRVSSELAVLATLDLIVDRSGEGQKSASD